MANYVATVRTNYFHVTDLDKLKALLKRTSANDADIILFDEEKDKDGNPVYGFGAFGMILGTVDPEDEDCEPDFGDFVSTLQSILPDGEACIILESGHEVLRYVVGIAVIITNRDVWTIDMTSLALDKAAEMLGNKDWNTQIDY